MKLLDVALGVVLGAGAFATGYLMGYVDARTQARPKATLLQRQAEAPKAISEWYPRAAVPVRFKQLAARVR